MRVGRVFCRALAFAFLALTLALGISGTFVHAVQSPPFPFPPTFPVNTLDFRISTSTTLIRIQPDQSDALVVWVDLYCPNSTTTIKCDSTVLQTINLQISGCPGGAFCILDRQQVNVPPFSEASSNLFIYTFSTSPIAPTLMTVTGTDQFGHSHSASFGVVACYCAP